MRFIEIFNITKQAAERWVDGIPDEYDPIYIPKDSDRLLLVTRIAAFTLNMELVTVTSRYRTSIICNGLDRPLYQVETGLPELVYATTAQQWEYIKKVTPWIDGVLTAWMSHWHLTKQRLMDVVTQEDVVA